MNKDQILKLIGIVGVLFLMVNLVLFALRLISWILFWVIIILAAVLAYKVLPRMKK